MIVSFKKNNGGGYDSGYTDGQNSIISTFSSTTATVNGDYGSSAHPLSSITVNIAQTGHTDQELQEAYSSGYTSGETHQKSLLSTTAITLNGNYENVNGWSGLSVSIDTASTFNSGYASGVTDGENNIKSTFTSTAVTENGQYGDSAHPLTAITVNVPTSSGGSEDFAKLIDRSITNAVIPSGVTTIGKNAFQGCGSLSAVTFPDSLTSIGGSAFYQCGGLLAVTLPNSLTSIGSFAFDSCSSLSAVTLPNSLTSIGSYAFESCRQLTAITLPNQLGSIESCLFYGCSNLQTVTIPNSVRSIGSMAFINCSSLAEIYCNSTTAPTISNANAFQNVPSAGTVHIPSGADYSSWQSNQYLSGWTFVSPTPTPTGSTGTLSISLGNSIEAVNDEGTAFDGLQYTVTLSGQSQDVVGIAYLAMDPGWYSAEEDPDSIETFESNATYVTGNTATAYLWADGNDIDGWTVDYTFIKAYAFDSNNDLITSISAISENIYLEFEGTEEQQEELCSLCGGSGEIEEDGEMVTCPNCGGSGIEPSPEGE